MSATPVTPTPTTAVLVAIASLGPRMTRHRVLLGVVTASDSPSDHHGVGKPLTMDRWIVRSVSSLDESFETAFVDTSKCFG